MSKKKVNSLSVEAKGLKREKLFGKQRVFAKRVESIFDVKLSYYNNRVHIYPNNNNSKKTDAQIFFKSLIIHLLDGHNNKDGFLDNYLIENGISEPKKDHELLPQTKNQKHYMSSINDNIVTFVIGPAGTGKTYVAVSCAVKRLLRKNIRKIILVRPIIEAGEKLGYLPGNIKDKVDPYMRPIYDALGDFLSHQKIKDLLDKDIIEISPLAFMRGRTFNNAFIILDEAQNITTPQMKMFLTRIGENTKVVINGDITQIDLKYEQDSGLLYAIDILKDVTDIGIVRLDNNDIIRSDIVKNILKKFDENG